MMDIFKRIDTKKTGIFAAGVLFGTAGIMKLELYKVRKGFRLHCVVRKPV